MSEKRDGSGKGFLVLCAVLVTIIILLAIVLALVIRSVRQETPETNDRPAVTTTDKAADIKTSTSSDESAPATTTEKPAETETSTGIDESKPATETATEAPKTDKPITDAPVTDAPVTDAPVTEPVTVTEPQTTESAKEPVVPVVREPESSGSFYSTNEQKIKLFVEWNSVRSESGDSADLNVKVYIECYSLEVGARTDNKITVNGKSYSFETPKTDEHFSSPTKVLLADKTVSVDLTDGNTVSLDVSWNFKGSYSGVEIDYIEASDVIVIK